MRACVANTYPSWAGALMISSFPGNSGWCWMGRTLLGLARAGNVRPGQRAARAQPPQTQTGTDQWLARAPNTTKLASDKKVKREGADEGRHCRRAGGGNARARGGRRGRAQRAAEARLASVRDLLRRVAHRARPPTPSPR